MRWWPVPNRIWQQDYDHLLLSFHGLPERHLHKLDPTGNHCFKNEDCCQKRVACGAGYLLSRQCLRTAELFAAAHGPA
jgi:protoporphyrin/coproporphyrin ferrochelatase